MAWIVILWTIGEHLSRYIRFYLSIIATEDNIPLLYHLAAKAKTVRDAESHTYSEVRLISILSAFVINNLVEPLRVERTCSGIDQGPRTGAELEYYKLSWEGQNACGYFPWFAKPRGGE